MGFALSVWEHIDPGLLIKFEFDWQIKLAGKSWGTDQ